MSQADSQHARAAACIQKPAVAVQARLLGQDGLELRCVRGAAVAIVGSRAEVEGRVIRHRTSIPGPAAPLELARLVGGEAVSSGDLVPEAGERVLADGGPAL